MATYHLYQYNSTEWHTRLVCLECGNHLYCKDGKVNRIEERVCPGCGRWICTSNQDSVYAKLAEKMAIMPMRYVSVPLWHRYKYGKPHWLVRFKSDEVEPFNLVKLKLKYAERWDNR